MGNLIIQLLMLMFFLWVLLIINKNVLLTPAVAFVASFMLATAYALFSLDYIQLELSSKTLMYVMIGITTFVLVSSGVSLVVDKNSIMIRSKKNEVEEENYRELTIEPMLLIIYIVISVYVIYSYRNFYVRITGLNSFTEAVYAYRNTTMFGNEELTAISGYIYLLRIICVSSGYILSYALIHGIVYRYNNRRVLLAVSIILSGICSILSGSRGPIITFVLTIMMQFYLILGNKKGWRDVINKKMVFVSIVIVVVIIGSFEAFGGMLGRGTAKTLGDYLAVYVSAPLKNLDTYVRQGDFGSKVENNQTFVYIVNYIGNTFEIKSWAHSTDQPFQYNSYGSGLGNVYTTFYAFLYDGGLFGVIILTALMAVICQWVFYKAIHVRKMSKSYVNLSIMVYSYLYPYLCMSFFSNKFYENIFNPLFIRYFIVWFVLSRFLFRIKIRFTPKLTSRG